MDYTSPISDELLRRAGHKCPADGHRSPVPGKDYGKRESTIRGLQIPRLQ
jgi:hypothetical protein